MGQDKEKKELKTMAASDENPKREIDTGGGAYIRGNVDIGSDNFVGRDVIGNIVNVFRNPNEARDLRNRQYILARVKEFWIRGVLENSLYQGILLPMELIRADGMVDSPWNEIKQLPNSEADQASTIPSITSLIELYNTFHDLLILGAPGSGKSTLLLDLARHTIAQAEAEQTMPIPIILNLSTWTPKARELSSWLVDELNDKYHVPRAVSQYWVVQDQLLLLLDGLDEVAIEAQQACVEAINAYRADHNCPAVVCCRMDEYSRLATKLKFQAAVTIQPLSHIQVIVYLESMQDDRFAKLRKALQQDLALSEMVQNPLMLRIMMEAYSQDSLDEVQLPAYQQINLFDIYVQRMFERGTPYHPYSREKTVYWLHWLAQQLTNHAEVIFLIERMQPSWLANRTDRWSYVLLSRLILSLVSGLIGGSLIGLGFAFFYGVLAEGLLRGLVESILSCLLAGIIIGVIDILRIEQDISRGPWLRTDTYLQLGLNTLLVTICIGLAVWGGFALFLGSVNWLGFSQAFWTQEGAAVGLLVGILYGLTFPYRLRGSRSILTDDIQSIEYLEWSGSRALVGSIYGFVAALFVATITTFFPENETAPIFILFSGHFIFWVAIPYFIVLGGIFGGLRRGIAPAANVPNQGIWMSARNALWTGGTVGVGLALLSAFLGVRQWDLRSIFILGIYGSFLGVPVALWYGGIVVIKHTILRYILFRAGDIPINYARFLNYAAERIFLRKVGGSYMFISHQLLDYFAGLNIEPRSSLAHDADTNSLLMAKTKLFFTKAGFQLQLQRDSMTFLCQPVASPWTEQFKTPVYARLFSEQTLDRQAVIALAESIPLKANQDAVFFAIIDQTPTDDGWLEIGALRSLNIQIIPVDDGFMQKASLHKRERQELQAHLRRFLGRQRDLYNVRDPVGDRLNFFGREAYTNELLEFLVEGQPTALLGLRKMGKSSLLQVLRDRVPFPVAHVDLQAGIDLPGLYTRIFESWQRALRISWPDLAWVPPVVIQNLDDIFITTVNDLLRRLDEHRYTARLGIFVDEIELILPQQENDDKEGLKRYLTFTRTLRGVIQETGQLSLMIVGVDAQLNRAARLGNQQNPFYQFFQEQYLGPLSESDCIQMVRNIGRQMGLVYGEGAAEAVATVSGGHPFLARQVCSMVLRQRGEGAGSEITLAEIEAAADQFVRDPGTAANLDEGGMWGEVTNPALWPQPQVVENAALLTTLAAGAPQSEPALLGMAQDRQARERSLTELEQRAVLGRLERLLRIQFGLFQTWIQRYQIKKENAGGDSQ